MIIYSSLIKITFCFKICVYFVHEISYICKEKNDILIYNKTYREQNKQAEFSFAVSIKQ